MLIFLRMKQGIEILRYSVVQNALLLVPRLLFTEVHGKQGLGPIIPNGNVTNGEMENFFEVIPLIEQYKDELIIVSLGRLTSLAILFILCKQLMKQIKSYYVMGGAFYILVMSPLFLKQTFMAILLPLI